MLKYYIPIHSNLTLAIYIIRLFCILFTPLLPSLSFTPDQYPHTLSLPSPVGITQSLIGPGSLLTEMVGPRTNSMAGIGLLAIY